MSENNQELSERERELVDFGFLNAVGRIHQRLDADEKDAFKNMLTKAFKSEAPKILKDGLEVIANENNCQPGCSWVRGMGCVCD